MRQAQISLSKRKSRMRVQSCFHHNECYLLFYLIIYFTLLFYQIFLSPPKKSCLGQGKGAGVHVNTLLLWHLLLLISKLFISTILMLASHVIKSRKYQTQLNISTQSLYTVPFPKQCSGLLGLHRANDLILLLFCTLQTLSGTHKCDKSSLTCHT